MEYLSLKEVETRIDKNYSCVKELEQLVSSQNTDGENLELIVLIGMMYTMYITGVYSSSTLERRIAEIGKKIKFYPSDKPKDGKILIVMSQCGVTGGHTVLVHNWIKWDDMNQYSIVFTDRMGFTIPGFVKDVVQESGGKITYLSGTYMEKAKELLELSQNFQRILLFTDMFDIIPVLAYSNERWKTPVYFYNHADFRFSYGFSVSDLVLNLMEFDVDKTIRYRGIDKKNSIYLQFPGQSRFDAKRADSNRDTDKKIIKQKYGVKEDEKLIVSMGDDFKFNHVIGYEFDTYVADVLKRSSVESSFLIIGADKTKEKWICLKERTHGRGRALGRLPRDEAEQLISAADLYIISFPMGAAGRVDAEKANVPWLRLDIYGRAAEKKDIRVSMSINELVEKTLDVLEGNGNRYLPTADTEIWTKQKWKRKWEEIYAHVTDHDMQIFNPRRHIEKQEIINCQLMQERAADSIAGYIIEHHLRDDMKKELFRLDRKYDMGIIYAYTDYLEQHCQNSTGIQNEYVRLANKHLQLYLTSLRWIEIKQQGMRIEQYLFRQGYHTTAIYGMSYMGEILMKELSVGPIKVLYGIDRNAEKIQAQVKIYKPSDALEEVDVILNTTTISNSELLKEINADNVKMICLSELFEIMYSGEV